MYRGGLGHEKGPRRDRSQGNARRGTGAVITDGHGDGGPDDGNIHLRPRREPQIGVAAARAAGSAAGWR